MTVTGADLRSLDTRVLHLFALVEEALADAAAAFVSDSVDQACEALTVASENLLVIVTGCGLETPLGRRLHELRSRLDAHLLAASALKEADAGGAVVSVLRRSVDFVGLEMERLLSDRRQLDPAGSSAWTGGHPG
jgi:hypothetical protein